MSNAKKATTKELTEFVFENGQLIQQQRPKPKTKESERSRKFTLITYINYDVILKYLRTSAWIQHWAMCIHDMDVESDGITLKQEHIHIVLYTYDAKTSRAVKKNFDRYSVEIYRYSEQDVQNTRCEICYDIITQYRYLLHLDDPDKYQYARSRRITDNDYYWSNLEYSAGMSDVADNKGLAIINDLINGSSEREMIEKYGNAWIWHRQHYLQSYHAILREEHKPKTDNILEIMQIMLSDSPFKDSDINAFFNILSHIKAECFNLYRSELKIYLNETENEK